MLRNNKKKGFTLIEIMAALFVLGVGLIGIMGLIFRISASTSLVSSKLIAAYLSQEGIELVRNLRDENWLSGDPWDFGLNQGEYEMDYNDSTLFPWVNQGRYLKFNNSFYNYESGQETIFKRKIRVDRTAGPDEILICSVVQWQERGISHQVQSCEKMYNWKT
jgi:prepilin-type N-terminal cleavage/methylation domain-containing protein